MSHIAYRAGFAVHGFDARRNQPRDIHRPSSDVCMASILSDETSPSDLSCGAEPTSSAQRWRSRRDEMAVPWIGSPDQERDKRPRTCRMEQISVRHSLVYAMKCGNLGHRGRGSAQAFAKKQKSSLRMSAHLDPC